MPKAIVYLLKGAIFLSLLLVQVLLPFLLLILHNIVIILTGATMVTMSKVSAYEYCLWGHTPCEAINLESEPSTRFLRESTL